jgi:hypothetical protein
MSITEVFYACRLYNANSIIACLNEIYKGGAHDTYLDMQQKPNLGLLIVVLSMGYILY